MTSKKVRRNKADFLPFKITLKRVRQNNVDFSPIEITWSKISRNNIDFSPIKITIRRVVSGRIGFYIEFCFGEFWFDLLSSRFVDRDGSNMVQMIPMGFEPKIS